MLNESKRCGAKFEGRKPNKAWAYKGCEFYDRPITLWLQDNNIEMYSTHNEGKSI